MEGILVVLLLAVSGAISLNCHGPADVVIAVPACTNYFTVAQFRRVEEFLIPFASSYDISSKNTHVGLVLYGKEPIVISDLEDAMTIPSLNARISLLSQRQMYDASRTKGLDLPKAIAKIHSLLNAGRSGVPKIGVVLTCGGRDNSATNPLTVQANVAREANAARQDGIDLFAASIKGLIHAGFENITDTCRMFSSNSDFTDLGPLSTYLFSATCYVLDTDVVPTPSDCFPELIESTYPYPSDSSFDCPSGETHVPDPDNCAYFYQCPGDHRMPCPPGLLFDPTNKVCNHKQYVSCYSGLSCLTPTGMFRHPHSCQKFLLCSNNIPYPMDCPAGLAFDAIKKYCDYPFNVDCADG